METSKPTCSCSPQAVWFLSPLTCSTNIYLIPVMCKYNSITAASEPCRSWTLPASQVSSNLPTPISTHTNTEMLKAINASLSLPLLAPLHPLSIPLCSTPFPLSLLCLSTCSSHYGNIPYLLLFPTCLISLSFNLDPTSSGKRSLTFQCRVTESFLWALCPALSYPIQTLPSLVHSYPPKCLSP